LPKEEISKLFKYPKGQTFKLFDGIWNIASILHDRTRFYFEQRVKEIKLSNPPSSLEEITHADLAVNPNPATFKELNEAISCVG